MLVSEVLEKKGAGVNTITSDKTISDAIDELQKENIGSLVVVDSDEVILGLITERSVIHAISKLGSKVLKEPVSAIVDTDVRTCGTNDTLRQVLALMTEYRKRHVPVVEDGRLCGLISIGDAVKHRLDETMREADALRAVVGSLGPG